jgi:putative SOS response-associated peptidase YedK
MGELFDAEPITDFGAPLDQPVGRYNVSPTDPVAVVFHDGPRRVVAPARWGLVPHWSKDRREAARRINARGETLAESPVFRPAYRARRCIVPADGFYEWLREDGRKQPFFLRRHDRLPLAFAGLWERTRLRGEEAWTMSCTIVTTTPNEMVSRLHHRMPVILDERPAVDAWLDAGTEANTLADLLHPAPDDLLEIYPVTRAVNAVRNDGPELIEPAPLIYSGSGLGL